MARFTLNAWDNFDNNHLTKVLIVRKDNHVMELVKQRMKWVKGSMMYRLINDEINERANELRNLRNKLN